mmetsp:Transcript_41564/g.67317  ORF Transcript_41564/g.67317 Transcript_41564/m.67317 type:complete len:115 (+) Transcript_41564:209-553(+)
MVTSTVAVTVLLSMGTSPGMGLHLTWRARSAAIWRHQREGHCVVVWVCPAALGPSADVLIWDREGPQRAKGHFKDDEMGDKLYCPPDCAMFVGRRGRLYGFCGHSVCSPEGLFW